MSYTKVTPPSGGRISRAIGAQWRPGCIQERVTLTAGAAFATLSQQLPAGARETCVVIKNATDLTLDLLGSADTTAAAGTGQLALVYTAPSSLATNATANNLAVGPTATAKNEFTRGFAVYSTTAGGGGIIDASHPSLVRALPTAARTYYILPWLSVTAAGATKRFEVNTTATSGLTFGTTGGAVDVEIFFEEWVDTADQ